VSRGQRGETPTAINLCLLDWSPYFFFQVALHLCKILGFHSGGYEECHLLECYAMWLLYFFGACVGCPVMANVVPSSPILVTLMMEALHCSKTFLTRATWSNIPEDGILYPHLCS
jgi:hypothetical protein